MKKKVIDLYAGVGGLSLGAARAGFNVVAAVELDKHAISTHAKNFPNTIHLNKDIQNLTAVELLNLAGVSEGELSGVIGGPPCQGFSTMGKRDVDDPRNNLFNDFFRLVAGLSPDFFVAENVTGILDAKYNEIRGEALFHVKDNYDILPPLVIKASDFGVPTTRTRVFFIGLKHSVCKKRLTEDDFLKQKFRSITVEEALRGLPKTIKSTWLNGEDAWQVVDKSEFKKSVFFEKLSGDIPPNTGHKESLKKYIELNLVSGCNGTRHTPQVEARFSNLNFGQQDKVSKSVRLRPDGYCPTLRAGTGSDRGSYQAVRPVHYTEPRVITPREAARLQGFPDWFIFHDTKWHSFRQIGNSVSPLIAEHILKVVFQAMSS